MEIISIQKFLQTDFDDLKKLFESSEEDQLVLEISKLTPKVLENYYTAQDSTSTNNNELHLIKSNSLASIHKLFQLCELLRDQGKVLSAIEDIITCIDTQKLSEFLIYLESAAAKAIEKKENESKFKSIVLRMCNSLLKILGRKEHKHLRFRVQKILADCMGLVSERSGVNFRGQFASKKPQVLGVSDNLCTRVQQFFLGMRDPYSYFKDITKLERHIENLDKLFDEFVDIETYTNEFLNFTPLENVFEFQVKDNHFVTYFMGSLIFFAQTLTKPATSQQESGMILLEYHKNKLNLISSRAKSVLFKINPSIVSEIEYLLETEVPWINWKLNKCYKFEKDPQIEYPSEEKIELEEGELEAGEIIINNTKPLFEECEEEPYLENYVKQVLIDLNPDEQIEEEFHKKNDPVFCWRFLRLVSHSHLGIFEDMHKPNIEKIAFELKDIYKIENPVNGDIEFQKFSDNFNESENHFDEDLPVKRVSSAINSPSKHSCVSDT
jgi:THO complex subunit 1 transcription elongation factor